MDGPPPSPLSEQNMNSEGKSVLRPKGPSPLPVSGLRLKRPAGDENEPPKVDQKRARGPLDPTKPGGPVTATPSFPKTPPAGPELRSQRQAGQAMWNMASPVMLEERARKKLAELLQNVDNNDFVWLDEMMEKAKKMFTSGSNDEPELMPKTPPRKSHRKKKPVSSVKNDHFATKRLMMEPTSQEVDVNTPMTLRSHKVLARVQADDQGGRCRSSTRTRGTAGLAGPSITAGSHQTVTAAAPKPAAAPAGAGGGEKKPAPWDLRAKVGTYKEKAQGLARENESLRQRLNQLEGERKQLEGQNSALSVELQAFRAEATESLQREEQLVKQERQLQETIKNQSQTIQELETREAELRLAQGRLAQENDALAACKAQLEQKLHQSEMERRLLHNTIQELKGNIRVFCRVRPLLSSEKEAQKQGMSHLRFPPDNSKGIVLSKVEESHVGRKHKQDIVYEFNFDQVFPPSSSQEEVFEEISLLVQSALDGYHVCIFAYGQTGSGKTYTMEGPDCQDPSTAGMIPRAMQQIFKKAREMEAKGWKYQFTANCLEIYNESLRDLLALHSEQGSKLEIRRVNQCTEELHVPNLSYIPVVSEKAVLELLQRAKARRSVAKTNLNECSSRSHSLFQLRIEGHNANWELHTSSVLSLVDLAGSERLDKSLSTGDRLKETQAINSSLSNLARVITALSNKEAHVPFRDTKLTYLLRNSLGGNSKILMFVNISPAEENFAESLNSLRFAKKVNDCLIGTASNKK